MGFKLVQTSDSSQRGDTVSHACFLQVTDSEVSDVVQGLLQIGAILFILLVTQFFTKLKIKKKNKQISKKLKPELTDNLDSKFLKY